MRSSIGGRRVGRCLRGLLVIGTKLLFAQHSLYIILQRSSLLAGA